MKERKSERKKKAHNQEKGKDRNKEYLTFKGSKHSTAQSENIHAVSFVTPSNSGSKLRPVQSSRSKSQSFPMTMTKFRKAGRKEIRDYSLFKLT